MTNHHGLAVALRALQQSTRIAFPDMNPSNDSGEATIYINPRRIDVTNLDGVIVARGPVAVAKYLSRNSNKERGGAVNGRMCAVPAGAKQPRPVRL